MATLRNHFEMIDLNPLVIHRIRLESPPSYASAEECQAKWYQITDTITYMPGIQSDVSYNSCFNDLTDGLQTHTFAPAGVEIKSRWLLGGTLPGEPPKPTELGLGMPKQGLYLQEEVDLKCNFMLTSFVKKNLKKAHAQLVDKMLEKAKEKADFKNPASTQGSTYTTASTSNPDQAKQGQPAPAKHQPYNQPTPAEYQPYNQPAPAVYQQYKQPDQGFGKYKNYSTPQQQKSWINQYAPGSSSQPAELPSQLAERPPAELAG